MQAPTFRSVRLSVLVLLVSTALAGCASTGSGAHSEVLTATAGANVSQARTKPAIISSSQQPWWTETGKISTNESKASGCGVKMPNLTVLGPDLVSLHFGDQSPTDQDIQVQLTNIATQSLNGLSTGSEVIYLEPGTLNIVGYGGDDLMQRPAVDVKPGDTVSIHFLPDPRDCREVPSKQLPDGSYPAYLRIFAHGAVRTFLVPVMARVKAGSSMLSAPAS